MWTQGSREKENRRDVRWSWYFEKWGCSITKKFTKLIRKDKRTKIQASQQSEMIEQRKGNLPSKDFESKNNDILGSGFNLGM